ncbi:MAG TPA: hypothetical protein VJ302_30695 [Blastocatellia bacterium]|nr:hypothetical protein [Blastocatellia bacterium]
MAAPILTARDLDAIRALALGSDASLTFYSVTPSEGGTQLFSLARGWTVSRKKRGNDPSGSMTLIVSREAGIDVEQLRENAVVDLTRRGETQRYRVAEVTETQDLNSGWVLHVEPISGSV